MSWAGTIAPGWHTVAGHKLGPLTFGHAVLMERMQLFDVLTSLDYHAFIGVCSRSYAQGWKWLNWFLSPVGQWFYARRAIPGNPTETLTEVLDYLECNRRAPELLSVEGSTGASHGAPALQVMRTIAIERLNYNPDTLPDAPFGQLYWDILASNELAGGSRIIDGDLAETLKSMRA